VRVGMRLTAGASRRVQKKAYPHCFERNSRGDGMSTQKLELILGLSLTSASLATCNDFFLR
jgi:hypothetical protein